MNVLDTLPKTRQAEARALLTKIHYAETRAEASWNGAVRALVRKRAEPGVQKIVLGRLWRHPPHEDHAA